MLDAAELADLRADLAVFYVHTYTRTPMAEGATDPEGNARSEPGTPVTGLPCAYASQSRLRVNGVGAVTENAPTLTVPTTDPLAVGDLVSDIRDSEGAVL